MPDQHRPFSAARLSSTAKSQAMTQRRLWVRFQQGRGAGAPPASQPCEQRQGLWKPAWAARLRVSSEVLVWRRADLSLSLQTVPTKTIYGTEHPEKPAHPRWQRASVQRRYKARFRVPAHGRPSQEGRSDREPGGSSAGCEGNRLNIGVLGRLLVRVPVLWCISLGDHGHAPKSLGYSVGVISGAIALILFWGLLLFVLFGR